MTILVMIAVAVALFLAGFTLGKAGSVVERRSDVTTIREAGDVMERAVVAIEESRAERDRYRVALIAAHRGLLGGDLAWTVCEGIVEALRQDEELTDGGCADNDQ